MSASIITSLIYSSLSASLLFIPSLSMYLCLCLLLYTTPDVYLYFLTLLLLSVVSLYPFSSDSLLSLYLYCFCPFTLALLSSLLSLHYLFICNRLMFQSPHGYLWAVSVYFHISFSVSRHVSAASPDWLNTTFPCLRLYTPAAISFTSISDSANLLYSSTISAV